MFVLSMVVGLAVDARAADDDCRFTDLVTQKQRRCIDGPSKESRPYVSWIENSGFELVKDARLKFEKVFVHRIERGSTVGADPTYDEPSDEAKEREEAWEQFLALLKLFVLIVQGADAYIDALGLTGDYDGVVCGEDGTCVDAYLSLRHDGGDVDGRIVVKEGGLEIDGGLCGGVDVPVISLPVHASSSSPTEAFGGTTRQVDYTFFWTGDASVDFDLSLRSDRETLDVGIDLVLEDPCPDSVLSGIFHRRMDALLEL